MIELLNFLQSLVGEESSGVSLIKDHELTLSVSQSLAFDDNIVDVEFAVKKVLLTKFLEYEPRLAWGLVSCILLIIPISQSECSSAHHGGYQRCPSGERVWCVQPSVSPGKFGGARLLSGRL